MHNNDELPAEAASPTPEPRNPLQPEAAGDGAVSASNGRGLVLRRRGTVFVPTLVLVVGGSARRVGFILRRLLGKSCQRGVEILEFDTDRYEVEPSSGGWTDRDFVPLTVWRPSVILSLLDGRFPSFSWLHRAQIHTAIFRGAGQRPMIGALAFWANFPEVRARISAALGRLIALTPPGTIECDAAQVRVIIIASSAGGTGRGALIPMGLAIRDIIDEKQGSADANISVEAFILLHSCFQGVLDSASYQRAKANTYALFKELEYLEAHPADWPYRFRESEPIRRLKAPPFDRVVLVDSRTQSGQCVPLDDLYRFLAELLATRIGPRAVGSQKVDEISVNAPSTSVFGKRAVYQAIGGFVARFDRERTLDYAVPRFFKTRIADEVLLQQAVPPETFVADRLVPSPESILAKLEAAVQAEGDPLSPAQLARDTSYTPEFLRVNPPGDLAWEATRIAGTLSARRARFRQVLEKVKAELMAEVVAHAKKAFDAACAGLVGGVGACYEQLFRAVQALEARLADILPVDLRADEADHRVALDLLCQGPSLSVLRRRRTRARFRKWFEKFSVLVDVVRSADLRQACREVFEAGVAVLRARLDALGRLRAYLSSVSRSDSCPSSARASGIPGSAIIVSVVPPAADPRIYGDLLEKAIDPVAVVRESIGSFTKLLDARSEAEYATRLAPVVSGVCDRLLDVLLRLDIFEMSRRYGSVDLGRYLADALEIGPFISIERGLMGEHSVGELTIVTMPPGPEAERLRSEQSAELHVVDGEDPHIVAVTTSMTRIPLFALANLDSLREAYVAAMRRCKHEPEAFPHIHAAFLVRFENDEWSDEIVPRQGAISSEAKRVEGLTYECPRDD